MNSLFSLLFRVVLTPALIGGSFASPVVANDVELQSCEQVWAEMADLINHEKHLGVDAEWLEEVNELVPELAACASRDRVHSQDTDQWAPLVAAYFRPDDVERVLCLMELESRGDPTAVNSSSGASGLMQVMPSWAPVFGYTVADLQDPMVNLEIASSILDDYGWDSWSPYRRGSCH